MAIVYVAQEPQYKNDYGIWTPKGYDLSSLKDFGSLHVVWTPEPRIESRRTMESDALKVANEYRSMQDYVLAIGSPSLIALLGWAIGVEGKSVRLLQWDRRKKTYIEVLIP